MSISDLCEASIHRGLTEICITEHTEFGHPDHAADVPPCIEQWAKEIDEARCMYQTLEIKKGIEIGDNPLERERIKKWHAALDVDFLLLSLHLVKQQDPYYGDIYNGRSQKSVYHEYVEAKLESALAWHADEYDAFAHLGYCAKFAPYPIEKRPLRWHHAPELFDQLFKILSQNGKALEINTSGMRTMGQFIPDKELLTRFHELGGEFVTIGSDAHRKENVGNWISDAQNLAIACGFRYQLTFTKRKAIPIRL